MRKKILVLGFVCLFIYACATAPVPKQIKSTFTIEANFDDTWTAVIESFAEFNLPIQNMEKDSGLITTDWIGYPTGKKGNEYCDCGKLGMNVEKERLGRFNVFVKKINENLCEIRITCVYQQVYSSISLDGSPTPSYRRDCVSTGKFEADIYNLIKSKLDL